MKISQESAYAGRDRWRWSVWLDGTDAELDAVDHVEYTLHPTFPDPVRPIFDRASKFRLESAGWGEFQINARVYTKAGGDEHLRNWLRLEYPAGSGQRAEEKPRVQPRVLVSYAAADADWGQAIQAGLTKHGFDAVSTDDAIEAGTPWAESIASALDAAEVVVGVFSDRPSPSVEREMSEAARNDVTVVPIVLGSDAVVPEWLDAKGALPVETEADLSPAVDLLAKRYLA